MAELGSAPVLRTTTKLGRARKSARGMVPAPPPKPSRRLPWQKADFLVLHSSPLEGPGPPSAQVAWLPVRDGRIEVNGARRVKVSLSGSTPSWDLVGDAARTEEAEVPIASKPEEAPGLALDRRFLITWSAEDLVPILDKVFGGGTKAWFRRTIDVRRLAFTADRLAGDVPGPDSPTLAAVARRYRVPGPPPRDALDAALMTAELFLILATRLAAQGHRDVGSLLPL
jgi:hypothetical protein